MCSHNIKVTANKKAYCMCVFMQWILFKELSLGIIKKKKKKNVHATRHNQNQHIINL